MCHKGAPCRCHGGALRFTLLLLAVLFDVAVLGASPPLCLVMAAAGPHRWHWSSGQLLLAVRLPRRLRFTWRLTGGAAAIAASAFSMVSCAVFQASATSACSWM